MKFIKMADEEQKQKEAQELIDSFEKSLNLSTIDNFEKLEKVCQKMQIFQKEHKDIEYIEWGCSDETEIYSTLRRRIVKKIPNNNHLSILKDVIQIVKKKARNKTNNERELWYLLYYKYYCENLEEFPNIDNKTLRYIFDKSLDKVGTYNKIITETQGGYAYLSSEDNLLIKRLSKIIKKKDIVYSVEHSLHLRLNCYKFINSDLVDNVLREIGVYDRTNEYRKPLYLKVPLQCIPYDLLKTETIEYILTHMDSEEIYRYMGENMYIFDIKHDEIFGGRYLTINKYIAGYCLEKANAGEHKLLDILLDNIMSSSLIKDNIQYSDTKCHSLFDLIQKIQDKEYKQKIMDKYGITE